MLIVIGLAQFALLFVVSFGMIASAVCALLGPLFVPFFIVPTLEWLFWNWLKAFVQYSFMPVVANAFIFVFERFLSRYLQTLPPGLRLEEQLLYGVHAVMILVTFTVGVLARAVADELDLLGPVGRVRAARPSAWLLRSRHAHCFVRTRRAVGASVALVASVLRGDGIVTGCLVCRRWPATTCSAGGERRLPWTRTTPPLSAAAARGRQAPVRRALRLGAGDEHVPQDRLAVRLAGGRRARSC